MVLSLVQHKSGSVSAADHGSVTLDSAPGTGNLLLVFGYVDGPGGSVVKNPTGWTVLQDGSASGRANCWTGYRYAQAGDTATLPSFFITDGSFYFYAFTVYEISGVGGAIGSDAPFKSLAVSNSNVTTLSTGPLTATATASIALTNAAQRNQNNVSTLSSGWITDDTIHDGNYGSLVAGRRTADTGDSISVTVTFGGNDSPDGLMLVIVQDPNGEGDVTFPEIKFSAPSYLVEYNTQMGLNVAAIRTADPRVTQMAIQMLGQPSATLRNTQMGVLILAKGGDTPLTPNPLLLQDFGRDQIVYQRLVNMYVEATPQGPGSSAHFGRPGIVRAATRGGGPIRATFLWNGFRFTVSAGSVWRDDINIGAISTVGPVTFAFSDEEVVLTANGSAYYVTLTNVTQITSATIEPLNVIRALFSEGRFVYLIGQSSRIGPRFYWSELGDAQTVDGLSFAEVNENAADALVGGATLSDQIVFFTEKRIEWWYGSQDPDAPYQKSQGRSNDRGCVSQQCIVSLDNSLFFVGENRIVYRTGAVPVRVSDFSVEDKVRRVPDAETGNITAMGIIYGGHSFYVMNLPGQGSWALDISNSMWAEWKSWGCDFFRGYVCDTEKGVMGDLYSGDLMGFDGKTYDDKGDPLERICSTYIPLKTGFLKNFNLGLDCARGVGTSTGQGFDPQVEMKWSDHEGKLWTNHIPANLGMQGDGSDSAKALWYQLGTLRSPGRLFEFRCTDPVPFVPWQVRFNEARM